MAVKKFLNETHEQYKKYLGKNFNKLSGFFTDEPQYYRAKHAFTDMLPKYFREVYNQDIFDGLGLMFVEKDGYKDFRYKYWKATKPTDEDDTHCSVCKKEFLSEELIPVNMADFSRKYMCIDCISKKADFCNLCGEAYEITEKNKLIPGICEDCYCDLYRGY